METLLTMCIDLLLSILIVFVHTDLRFIDLP